MHRPASGPKTIIYKHQRPSSEHDDVRGCCCLWLRLPDLKKSLSGLCQLFRLPPSFSIQLQAVFSHHQHHPSLSLSLSLPLSPSPPLSPSLCPLHLAHFYCCYIHV